ncbi:Uncharacterised protein [Achromobacter sp. 2789STDY5608633]|uniref:hypothetical protein n=1 Tax=Achromobacter sp. 2789STDY5608633 TaxID=1806501 RepID=UPI0006C2B64D|nr:hypothetical protein [Achromobacter sp. 2789STDY5608633]CUJ51189.1 Uncharacterised protein [Achromobacter sp. 2789STDY5608633]
MTIQPVPTIAKRPSLFSRAVGSLQPVEPPPLAGAMRQLALDFAAAPQINDAIVARAHATQHVEPASAAPVATDAPPTGFTNDAYIRLVIDLLLTCAEDLTKAQAVLRDPASNDRSKAHSRVIHDETSGWLLGTFETPLSFQDCADLLEEEMRIQSLGQVAVPRVGERSDELARWILNDPAEARYVLRSYRTVFSPHGEGLDDAHEDSDDESAAPVRQRQTA